MNELIKRIAEAEEVSIDISNEDSVVRMLLKGATRADIIPYRDEKEFFVITTEMDEDIEIAISRACVESGYFNDIGAWVFDACGSSYSIFA